MTRQIAVPDPLRPLITNRRHGLYAALAFIVIWILLFAVAFMIAFGNPSPVSASILHALGNLLTFISPLWGIPAAYVAGAFFWKGNGA
jgi:hypothetical protein